MRGSKGMAVTVSDILNLNALGENRILGGYKGLNNVIKYVNILESIKEYSWLQSNMLLIASSTLICGNEYEWCKLIKQLNDVGSSAIIIKSKNFIDKLPDFIIADADIYGILSSEAVNRK